MAGKISKTKKQSKSVDAERGTTSQNKTAQIIFAIFAIILILSMVLSAVTSF